MLGDLLVRSLDVDLADGEVHATTSANTSSETLKLHGHTHDDRLLVVDLVEVDVEQSVRDRVELQLLHDGRMALAVDDEVDDVDVRRIDELAELRHRGDKRHGDGTAVLALLLTIDVAGHQALLAVLLRSFLSKGFTLLTCNVNLFHCVTLN